MQSRVAAFARRLRAASVADLFGSKRAAEWFAIWRFIGGRDLPEEISFRLWPSAAFCWINVQLSTSL